MGIARCANIQQGYDDSRASMILKRRVYVSMPSDEGLSERQNKLKWGIVAQIEDLGLEPQIFGGPTGGTGLAAGNSWSLRNVDAVMRRCVGAALIGIPKWRITMGRRVAWFPTDYSQYEGAAAYACGLPILAAADDRIEHRVVFGWQSGLELIRAPPDAPVSWLKSPRFQGPFQIWRRQVESRRDVFLGYSGGSRKTAEKVRRHLIKRGAKVLDWREFAPAGSILERIREASNCCTGAVFLFTKDDKLSKSGQVAPRDNVVLEAGYFAAAKGKERTLIIRQKGARMPADLGGDIYAPLVNRDDISPVTDYLDRFLAHCL